MYEVEATYCIFDKHGQPIAYNIYMLQLLASGYFNGMTVFNRPLYQDQTVVVITDAAEYETALEALDDSLPHATIVEMTHYNGTITGRYERNAQDMPEERNEYGSPEIDRLIHRLEINLSRQENLLSGLSDD